MDQQGSKKAKGLVEGQQKVSDCRRGGLGLLELLCQTHFVCLPLGKLKVLLLEQVWGEKCCREETENRRSQQ